MENYINELREGLNTLVQLPEEEWQAFVKGLDFKEYNTKEHLTAAGEVENYIYFIARGTVRAYYLGKQKEHTLDFCFDKDFISSYTSFITRKPSEVFLETLSSTQVIRFHHHHLHQLYARFKNSEKIGRLITESLYIRKARREIDLLSLSAEELYKALLKRSPEVVLQIPVKYLASYLGIQPESLSRIRKHIRIS